MQPILPRPIYRLFDTIHCPSGEIILRDLLRWIFESPVIHFVVVVGGEEQEKTKQGVYRWLFGGRRSQKMAKKKKKEIDSTLQATK